MCQHVNNDESAIRARVSVMSEPLDQLSCPRAKHVLGCGPNSSQEKQFHEKQWLSSAIIMNI